MLVGKKEISLMKDNELELQQGLNIDVIKDISRIKKEPSWMTDFRLKSYDAFNKISMPSFGPKIDLDFKLGLTPQEWSV